MKKGKRIHRRKREILCLSLAVCVGVGGLVGCSSGEDRKSETADKQAEEKYDVQNKLESLSEEEMGQTHLKRKLMDKVNIDAQITPYGQYGGRVFPTYAVHKKEQQKTLSKKNLKKVKWKELSVNGKPMAQIFKALESVGSRRFQKKQITVKTEKYKKFSTVSLLAPYISPSEPTGQKIQVSGMWDMQAAAKGSQSKRKLSMEHFYLSSDTEQDDTVSMIVRQFITGNNSYNKSELDFGQSEEIAKKLMAVAEKITGDSYCKTDYICIPFNKTNMKKIDDVMDSMQDRGMRITAKDIEPCYFFRFYKDIDGLPLISCGDIRIVKETDNIEPELHKTLHFSKWNPNGDTLQVYTDQAVDLIYDAEGLRCFETVSMEYQTITLDEFNEETPNAAVCDISTLLEQLQYYFNSTTLPQDATVYQIKLAYAERISKGDQSPICELLKPIWQVYYDTNYKGCKKLLFDGYTGEFLTEATIS